eukprot:gene11184-biopygen12386
MGGRADGGEGGRTEEGGRRDGGGRRAGGAGNRKKRREGRGDGQTGVPAGGTQPFLVGPVTAPVQVAEELSCLAGVRGSRRGGAASPRGQGQVQRGDAVPTLPRV